MGIIYLVAFVSLAPQLLGLIGADGILPVTSFLRSVSSALSTPAQYVDFPTVFWLSSSDTALMLVCVGGCLAALLVAAGILAGPCLIVCWIFYLSLVSVGQDFLSFQWDSLLLEAGFLAMFMTPWVIFDKPFWVRREDGDAHDGRDTSNSTDSTGGRSVVFMWLCRWLLFRLMFLSGLVKLMSGDSSWWHLSAMTFHYETQPLPTPLAWYMHHLPLWAQQVSTAGVLFTELAVPFLMLFGRRPRMVAGVLTIVLQTFILLTGNYTFFNLLTILLCVSLFDTSPLPITAKSEKKLLAAGVVACAIFIVSLVEVAGLVTAGGAIAPPLRSIIAFIQPFRIVNTYGLFAVMTKSRPEITVEGSNDGIEWKQYAFRFKPGPLRRAPPIVAPFQPRLDWQMWFAALGPLQQSPWFLHFSHQLLAGSPSVLGLLESNPFPDKPPQYVRAVISDYHFSTPEEKRLNGNWWRSDAEQEYMPPLQLRNFVE